MTSHFYTLGLTGYPLTHSLSPILHATAFKAVGIEGEYKLIPVVPDGQEPSECGSNPYSHTLASLADDLRSGRLDGLNITIPHKQAIIPFLDQLSPTALAVHAVNTLVLRDGLLYGDNTDVPGFLRDLSRLNLNNLLSPGVSNDFRDVHALILGAGGSARAVTYALALNGCHVTISARHINQAYSLIDHLKSSLEGFPQPGWVRLEKNELQSHINRIPVKLIVNTTPAGMVNNASASAWPEGLSLPQDCVVYDLVYNPRETPLMLAARRSGLPTFNGLGMLIEQAMLSFSIWTGIEPPLQKLVDSIIPELN